MRNFVTTIATNKNLYNVYLLEYEKERRITREQRKKMKVENILKKFYVYVKLFVKYV